MGYLARMLLIMIVVNVVFFAIQIDDPEFNIGAESPLTKLFDIGGDTIPELKEGTPFSGLEEQLSSSDTSLDQIDYSISVWGMLKSFLLGLFQFFYAPVAIMLAVSAPASLTLIAGVVWTFMYILGLISLIWRFEF